DLNGLYVFKERFIESQIRKDFAGSRPHPALHASAPENPPSCDSIKFKINDCSPYLKKDSSMAEPGTSCCLGLMDAWKDDSNCSDQVLKKESLVEARVSADQAKTDKAKEDEAYKDVPFVVVVVIVIALIWVCDLF
ncbi:hypothetical protein Tco_0042135, partial [Tanacetum coccineum]